MRLSQQEHQKNPSILSEDLVTIDGSFRARIAAFII
jgi:hypothetical protein